MTRQPRFMIPLKISSRNWGFNMYKYKIQATNRYKKGLKLMQRRGKNMELLKEAVFTLAKGNALPQKNHDHALTGTLSGYRECHIEPDWLLIYKITEEKLILSLTQTGTHSDLF